DWLEDNNWDLDEVIHDDDEQDAAIVADLFRKINNKPVASEQMSVTQSEIPIKAQESTRGERELGVGSDSSTPKSSGQESVRRFSPLPPLTKVTVRRRHQGTILVVSGLAMIIALIWWWNRRPLVANITNIPLSSPREITEVINLKTAKAEIVSGQAITELSQGNLDSGLLAVEELLNRGAFKLADTALSSVPSKHWKNPALNFLRGRLAWQSAQIRDKKYSIDDA
ncbi:MAG: hypothetical protein ACKO4R_16780, partial [Synechococcales cyanobacterium]